MSVKLTIFLRLQSFDEVVQDPGPKTTHEVAIFASGVWKNVFY